MIHTPYGASVCELALAGMGVGLVNPMTALDYADRGLVMRRLALDVRFRALLVLGVGRPMSVTARSAVTQLRKQLAADEKRMQTLLR